MSILIAPGSPVRLNVKLKDGATDKFLRATLRRADGAELAGSPVAVPHTAGGLYEADSFLMPDDPEVTASFKVYLDAGFTLPAPYEEGMDVYSRAADSIGAVVPQSALVLEATIVTGDLVGELAVGETLTGEVTEAVVVGEIAAGDITGEIVAGDIEGDIP